MNVFLTNQDAVILHANDILLNIIVWLISDAIMLMTYLW